MQEIHESLAKLQYSEACTQQLWDCDENFVCKLEQNESWVPKCSMCRACLHPNFLIFDNLTLVYSILEQQQANLHAVYKCFSRPIVLEIGGRVVVSSIRYKAEACRNCSALVHINPS